MTFPSSALVNFGNWRICTILASSFLFNEMDNRTYPGKGKRIRD
jgi:hypothetical protein